jgi:hypothetical protein
MALHYSGVSATPTTPRASTASLPASRVRSRWVLANAAGAAATAAAAWPAAKSGVMYFGLILK